MPTPVDVCLCGSFEFERVVVARRPGASITTDFLACVSCSAMYFVPLPGFAPPGTTPMGHGHAIGGPQPDSDQKLKRDAAGAAKDYVKPGRHGPPRHRR